MKNLFKTTKLLPLAILVSTLLLSDLAVADSPGYLVKSGDTLGIAVWNEDELTGDVIVHPDGVFSVPLAGAIQASGRAIKDIQSEIADRLKPYIPEAIVTVSLRETVGTDVYVIGQVNTPGTFKVSQPIDVMQALSLAQGMTAYAAVNKIKILRRTEEKQEAIAFRYGDILKGQKLDQNILLKNGDVVVVP